MVRLGRPKHAISFLGGDLAFLEVVAVKKVVF
jgi:hypothetical protein